MTADIAISIAMPLMMRPKRSNLAKTQSLDIVNEDLNEAQHASGSAMPSSSSGMTTMGGSMANLSTTLSSPGGSRPYSPFGSPRGRKRQPFRESRRVSIEHNESFLQLNQYKLYDKIGQVSGMAKDS